jgi:hypothetical protein
MLPLVEKQNTTRISYNLFNFFFLLSLSVKTHVLERHAIMVLVSMKMHHIDVNVIEVMKVQHVIDKLIHARILFVTMEVYVLLNRIINLCVNVHKGIEDRIVMNRMVCVNMIRHAFAYVYVV